MKDEPTMKNATQQERAQALSCLLDDARSLATEAEALGGNIWDFGEEMTACEGVIDQLNAAADNLVSYLEGRKKELGL
ncbi:hypothetical protein [Actinophytocola sp.]|uniref:hypothetical protein n=1 Tax=Actinophytocola sp. TaxID=1872138 RepID=UPI002D80CBC5|nr:hypothetical protein [Actinophytocola sp.]HET9144103.1 hypothetical protein [Actinophytocola sp.]